MFEAISMLHPAAQVAVIFMGGIILLVAVYTFFRSM